MEAEITTKKIGGIWIDERGLTEEIARRKVSEIADFRRGRTIVGEKKAGWQLES